MKTILQEIHEPAGAAGAIRACLAKYAVFGGRATRAEFWWWMLACILATVFSQGAMALFISASLLITPALGLLAVVFLMAQLALSLGTFAPTLAVTARRLHDTGRRGWWQLAWWSPNILFAAAASATPGITWRPDPEPTRMAALGGLYILGIAAQLAMIGWAILWLSQQGQERSNQYGENPREEKDGTAD